MVNKSEALIRDSFLKIKKYIEDEQYRGYDPYDTLNSWIPFEIFGKWPGIFATQIQKRNPINLRPLLGIKKEINPKGFGILLQSYSLLYKKTGDEKYLEKANYFFRWLSNNYTKGFSGYCWGYNFPWAGPDKYVKPYVPSSVVSGIIGKGIITYYEVTGSIEALRVLKSICRFLTNDLEVTYFDSGLCASYTPLERDCCYNASLLGGEIIGYVGRINNDNTYKKYAKDALDYVISCQKKDGRWNYSYDVNTGKERKQIDFHQGYILESIYNIAGHLNLKNEKIYVDAVKNGLEFYYKEQFYSNGQSKYRLPKVWPVDIHNQAQGIITFKLLRSYDSDFIKFSQLIAEWTIKNMQDKKTDHFYYKKYPMFSHKTSYMRWSQAWMFLALTQLIVSD